MKPPIPPRPLAKHVVAMLQPKTVPVSIQTRAAALTGPPPCASRPSAIQRALPVQITAKTIRPLAATPSRGVIQRFPVPVSVKGSPKTIHILSLDDSRDDLYANLKKVDVRVVHNEPILSSDLNSVHQLVDQINNLLTSHQDIVVHCQQGLHRSHVVVIYYLFRFCAMTLTDAFNLVERDHGSHRHTKDSLNNIVFGGPPKRGSEHDWNIGYNQLAQRGTSSQNENNNNNNNVTTIVETQPPVNNSHRPYMKIGETEAREVVREGNNWVHHGSYS